MYAVVSSGGKQYRVEPGTTITMERIGAGSDGAVTFDRVLLVGDGDRVTVGTPLVAGATVSATVLGQELGPKLVIFKFKQKVKYRRRTGHRQRLIRVRIDAINADGEKPRRASRARKAAAPAAAGPAEAKAAPTKAAATKKAPARSRARGGSAAKPGTKAPGRPPANSARPATKATGGATIESDAEPVAEKPKRTRRTIRKAPADGSEE